MKVFLWIKKVSGGANERGEYWLVKTKDGTSYRFGFTNTSEIVSTLEPYAVRWNLDRVEDSHGNVMDYVYYDSGAVSYPLEIRYADGLNLVRFIYSNSSQNQRSFYSQGSEMREPPLLGQIEITHRGNLVRSHELSYVPLETRSFLESIRLIGSDGILSLPATRFSYAAVGGGWVEQGNLALPSGVSFGTTRDQGVRLVDVTGDGFTDIIRAANSNAVEQWDGVGNGWASPGRNSLNGLVSGGFVDQYGGDQGIRFVDINGDTRVDVLQIVSGTNILRRALLNRGNSWEADSLNIPSEISFNELRSSCVPEYCPSGYDETGFNCDSNGCTRACAQVTCSGSGNLVRSGVAQDPQWNDDDHDESDAGPSFTPAPNKCYKFEYIGSFDTDGDDSECYDLTTDDDYGDYDISCNGEDENAYGSLGFSGNRQSA